MDAQKDYDLLKTVYGQFHDAEAMRGLVQSFLDRHAARLKLPGNVRNIDAVLIHPDKAERVKKDDLFATLRSTFKFDAGAAFSSKVKRGGSDPQLLKILASLDPELDPLEQYFSRVKFPKHEPEIERRNTRKTEKAKELTSAFATARQSFISQTTSTLLTGNYNSSDYAGQNACRWIADHIVGGRDLANRMMETIETLTTIGHHATANAQEAIRIAQAMEKHRNTAPAPAI